MEKYRQAGSSCARSLWLAVLLCLPATGLSGNAASAREGSPVDPVDALVFHSEALPNGPVTLAAGQYSAPAAPGAATRIEVLPTDHRVFGAGHDTQIGAVVFITSSGGSGRYRELALLTETAEGWQNTDTVLLGDRVKVHSVTLEGDNIIVTMTGHAPDDPQCCPTQDMRQRFAVQDKQLVPVTQTAPVSGPRLAGPVWQWLETRYGNDTQSVPDKPENYTVHFQDDGQLEVRADCNLKSGSYTDDGNRLSVTILLSTMAACEPGSLDEVFTRDLEAAAIYFFRDGHLYIDLPYDSGTMKFGSQSRE